MKRISITFLALALCAGAWAQNIGDAFNYSRNEYGGTAKSVGMGNAMTAVGGDMGSLVFNPAGSAVPYYSQFVLTPGLAVTSVASQGTALSGSTEPYGFEDYTRKNLTRLIMPQFGFTMQMDNHRRKGLKSWTFGFSGQTTRNFQSQINACGTNDRTSYSGYLAALAEGSGYNGAAFDSRDSYWGTTNCPWRGIVGYRSNMIGTYGGSDKKFLGAAEQARTDLSKYIPGLLDQQFSWKRTGFKMDYLFNVAANISDWLYIGANLGMVVMDYESSINWCEQAQDPSLFTVGFVQSDNSVIETSFTDLRFRQADIIEGSGVYLKTGFIAVPVKGLRIGAAIQTPTVMTIEERYLYDGYTNYSNKLYSASEQSETGDWQYNLISPFRYNVGIAYTIGHFGLVSFDYEACNYRGMHYSAYYDDDDFGQVNYDVKNAMGTSHLLRAGIELKPTPATAVRAGYNLTTSPFLADKGVAGTSDQSASFGLGYSSNGSFFADFALRLSWLADAYYMVYPDYGGNLSPEIATFTNRTEALFTCGWRF